MTFQRFIYADGVVTESTKEDAQVLSVCQGAVIRKNEVDLSAFREVWGEWLTGSYREIRLYLTINGQIIYEGETGQEPSFFDFARRIARRQRSLSGDIGILLYNFNAAHAHLRSLLRAYGHLTSVIGPPLPFDSSPVCVFDYPECYAYFDACLASLRAFADSSRFLVWRLLDRSEHIPRSLRTLIKADLPAELKIVLDKYLEHPVADLTEYRDNAMHYAPPGAHMAPYLLCSKGVIHAQVWLPENPNARSLKRFRYRQKDAYRYAKGLLEETYSFCNAVFPVLDSLQREAIRRKRRTSKES